METKSLQSKKILALTQSAIFIALATVLSFLPIYKMPMGGSVTLASMLPILFIGLKFGYKWGLGSAGIYAFIQLMQALIEGNVFIYCKSFGIVLVCALFDYIVPFAVLGLSALAKPKEGEKLSIIKAIITFAILVVIRFACHLITGVIIWGQWAPEGMGKFLYSLIYNGQFMLPELVITLVISALLMSSTQIEKLLTKEK